MKMTEQIKSLNSWNNLMKAMNLKEDNDPAHLDYGYDPIVEIKRCHKDRILDEIMTLDTIKGVASDLRENNDLKWEGKCCAIRDVEYNGKTYRVWCSKNWAKKPNWKYIASQVLLEETLAEEIA